MHIGKDTNSKENFNNHRKGILPESTAKSAPVCAISWQSLRNVLPGTARDPELGHLPQGGGLGRPVIDDSLAVVGDRRQPAIPNQVQRQVVVHAGHAPWSRTSSSCIPGSRGLHPSAEDGRAER